jgi:hypothetical protein
MSSATEAVRFTASLALLALSACHGSDESADNQRTTADTSSCISGDPTQPIEVNVVYRGANGELVPGTPMASIPLIEPPQGGEALFVGVRARNLAACNVTLSVALVDGPSGSVVAVDQRPVALELADDGWLVPQRSSELINYSNVPACPQAGIPRSVDGNDFEVHVTLKDPGGRSGDVTLDVLPTCSEGGQFDTCHCLCSKDYKLGGGCDAGVSDGDSRD